MTAAARAPEDVDQLLEDAILVEDGIEQLFDETAVLVDAGGVEARGPVAIARALGSLRLNDASYVAHTRRVARNGDAAIVVADAATHVLRRVADGTWRVTITLLEQSIRTEGK